MQFREQLSLAVQGATASRFSLGSNVLAVFTGLMFFGALVSLTMGVGQFLERYYTRTMSLTTLLVHHDPDASDVQAFDQTFREQLKRNGRVRHLIYHELNFADAAVTQGRSVTVALRSGIEDDPEIGRLERIAGGSLTALADGPLQPSAVISLTRAQQLSDLPPEDLVGLEMALTFGRSLNIEEDDELVSLYARIVGVVNETPDECVYVPYPVLAAVTAWQRETAASSRASSTDREQPIEESPDVVRKVMALARDDGPAVAPLPVFAQPPAVARKPDGKPPVLVTALKPEAPIDDGIHSEPVARTSFRYGSLDEAWEGIRPTVEKDTIVYPHLRVHAEDIDTMAALRAYFREQGIPTSSMLDDVAAIRQLRTYAIIAGSAIGVITLIAAMCSIFNTVLASVERRTQEIGILRALGASTHSVLSMFLLEGALVAVIGGTAAAGTLYLAVGAANRWVLSQLADNPEFAKLASIQPEMFAYSGWLALAVIGLGVGASLLASLGPSIIACRIEPATALRHT